MVKNTPPLSLQRARPREVHLAVFVAVSRTRATLVRVVCESHARFRQGRPVCQRNGAALRYHMLPCAPATPVIPAGLLF